MTRPLRRSLAASVATLALVSLSACGSDGDTEDKGSDSPGTSASTSADESPSASTSESADSGDSGDSGATAGEQITAAEFSDKLKTALDEATTADVTTTTSALGMTAKGQVDYTSDPPAVEMSADIPQMGSLDMVLADNVMYLKGDAFGPKYVKIALDDPSNPLASLSDSLDPAAAFANLAEGIDSATYDGQEDVDGDQLDHYTTQVESKALLQELPAEVQQGSGLPDTITYEWWFDGDGLIRKFSADMGSVAGTTEGTFDNWGTDVDIEAPPASEVTDKPAFPQPVS